ncbi:DNA endonuclease SmrA [Aestuariibacter salexigens]|uniref:DNA endonuclease SmrA n=1 Tax=Aestuariibacter salexigens TaxID=226010 RepID=UPI00047C64A8|nr:DNA endonuclease SmrA [Aestuariibacter salexigens]
MANSTSERDLFWQEMGDVKPLRQDDPKVTIRSSQMDEETARRRRESAQRLHNKDPNFLSVEAVTPVDPMDELSFKKDGVQHGVFKNLRLGKYQIDSTLNLQSLSFEQARQQVFDTINQCHKKGVRTLLIRHGLGINSKPFAGFMKSYVNRWLRQMDAVIAFHSALKIHGGYGAVYVLLKKSSEEKLLNRELHSKR